MKLKKYKKKKLGSYISISLWIVIASLVLSFVIINDFSKKANLVLLPMAESITRKVIAMVINSECDKIKFEDNLYVINKDNDNKIEMITYNSFLVNKVISDVTLNIENKLRDIELGKVDYYNQYGNGVIAEIPFGLIYDNSLLNNLGPKIKLKLNILGDILSNIETEVKPYGINNAYVEVRIKLDVTARVVLPFVSEKIHINQVVPISMNVVNGNVPDGYVYSYK